LAWLPRMGCSVCVALACVVPGLGQRGGGGGGGGGGPRLVEAFVVRRGWRRPFVRFVRRCQATGVWCAVLVVRVPRDGKGSVTAGGGVDGGARWGGEVWWVARGLWGGVFPLVVFGKWWVVGWGRGLLTVALL